MKYINVQTIRWLFFSDHYLVTCTQRITYYPVLHFQRWLTIQSHLCVQ